MFSLSRLFRAFRTDSRGTPTIAAQPTIIPRDQHQVSRQKISPNSLKILYRLNEAGYQAFIVGGGVRDLLLGLTPKDFDIATDATPEQVKEVFRNARIIGRRFRIVHVHFGREIIEVSTFRASQSERLVVEGESLPRRVTDVDSAHSQSGMILRDNVYGDLEGDVTRRDFTVNALYYTVRNFEIHDYYNGMADIRARTLRMIGDPALRYREDPVRILRALRLAAKLDFSIEPGTAAPIAQCSGLLDSVPPARLFDEFMKLFFAGKARATFELMMEYGVFQALFPATEPYLRDASGIARRMLEGAFDSTDERVNEGKSVTPSFLLAAILWPALQESAAELQARGLPSMPAVHEAAQTLVRDQASRLSIPKRFSMPMKEIWEYQLRLPRRSGRRAEMLLSHKRFRAAYDFLLLREEAGEDLDGLGQWWTQFQEAGRAERDQMQAALGKGNRNSKGRRRRVKSGGKKKDQDA